MAIKGKEKDKGAEAFEKKGDDWSQHKGHHHGGSVGFGVFLVLVGLFFLAKEYGWIPASTPWLPVLLIGFGAFLVIKGILGRFCCGCC